MATQNCTACGLSVAQYLYANGHKKCFTCITENIDLGKFFEDMDSNGLSANGEGVCSISASKIAADELSLKSHSSLICQNCYQYICSVQGSDIVQHFASSE